METGHDKWLESHGNVEMFAKEKFGNKKKKKKNIEKKKCRKFNAYSRSNRIDADF